MRLVSRFLLQTACLDRSDLHWKLLAESCLGSKLEARVGVKRSPAYVGSPGSGDLQINRLIHTDLQILNNASPIGALPDGMTMDLMGQDADGKSYKLAEGVVRDGQLHFRRRHRTADQAGS